MLRKWSKGGKISNWTVIRATANYKQLSDAREDWQSTAVFATSKMCI
jgi:hypothetical protein